MYLFKFLILLIFYNNLSCGFVLKDNNNNNNNNNKTLFPCESNIYCHGELLHTIQLAHIFDDSKTFVDKQLIYSPKQTMVNFKSFMKCMNNKPNKSEIIMFVKNSFKDGNELEDWIPTDFKSDPEFLKQIDNTTVQKYAKELVNLWPKLARKVRDEVSNNSDQYSIIPVPHGFIVPGGRFREYYYWDSYWVIKGLLISEMSETARGMIDNFISLVQRYGFVPNGGRIYYLNRSQPPLLMAMAYSYYQHTNDDEWIKQNIEYLDRELQFWLKNRTINIQMNDNNFTVAHYCAESSGPRPESYIEDYTVASQFEDLDKQEQLYMDIKSGAEAGWDFSSRWFIDETGKNRGNLSNINTRRIIPVDLNAILCGAFKQIADMYLAINDLEKNAFWLNKNLEWRKMIESVLWDEEDGIWYDLDSELLKPRRYFYASSVAPLWMHCYNEKAGFKLGKRVAKFLESKDLLNYIGGIPTSLEQTGEQWDFPNAWPPLQDIVIEGLATSGNPDAEEMAKTFAKRWVNGNILGYLHSGEMFEKYNVLNSGQRGSGGEYIVQTGFGWSNGVVLKFIHDYFRKS
ncbi:hypothetical protein ILUMI_27182 [Ignelater luminosus]|uniref:Trehalase n=1 Tax=Ignelater luminosus TaxID=2038154 RepID=A0A8K0FVR1_IGNLU|nr:hypothetical protein ILUMI_27182 [Ignelater luminosus]